MKNKVIIKPIFWRLLIWVVVPFTMAWLLGNFAYQITHPDTSFEVNWLMAVGLVLGAGINAIVFRSKFNIVIAEGNISGLSTGLGTNTVTFPITEFDKASVYKQSIVEKIFGLYTLRSTSGHNIMFPHFIYGKAAVNRVYETLEKYPSENTDQKVVE